MNTKVWHAGRASQEELDELDRCDMCRRFPHLAKTCWATKWCHRQMRMEGVSDQVDKDAEAETIHAAGR